MRHIRTSLLTALIVIAAGPAVAQHGGGKPQGAPTDFSRLAEARLGGVATISPAATEDGAQASGSGFAIDSDGIFITHAAVLRGASSVQVELGDGTTLDGSVAATHEESGVAVIETQGARDLPVLPWSRAQEPALGSWLVALGRPEPNTPTVAVGIVSAPVTEFVRSDLAIGPANLGGPVLNAAGQVVGLGIVTQNASGAPVGAILPAGRIHNALNSLSAETRQSREPARLGVVVQGLDQKLAEALGTKEGAGVVIAAVKSGSPAEAAGLRPGDVIRQFGDRQVTAPAQLRELVERASVKAPVELTVERAGETMNLSVDLAKSAPTMKEQEAKASAGPDETAPPVRLGVRVTDLTENVAKQLGLTGVKKGAVVVAVQSGSPAEQAGIKPGDVILAIGDRSVDRAADLVEALKMMKQNGKANAALRVYRDGTYRFIPVTV